MPSEPSPERFAEIRREHALKHARARSHDTPVDGPCDRCDLLAALDAAEAGYGNAMRGLKNAFQYGCNQPWRDDFGPMVKAYYGHDPIWADHDKPPELLLAERLFSEVTQHLAESESQLAAERARAAGILGRQADLLARVRRAEQERDAARALLRDMADAIERSDPAASWPHDLAAEARALLTTPEK